ncbi:MAG: hypothetical protein ACW98D_14055 [Promethearchaeota archaeon]|jgi:hypothetical protein
METLTYPRPRYNFVRFEQGTEGITYFIVLYDNDNLIELNILMPINGGADWFTSDTEIIIIRPVVNKKSRRKKKIKR